VTRPKPPRPLLLVAAGLLALYCWAFVRGCRSGPPPVPPPERLAAEAGLHFVPDPQSAAAGRLTRKPHTPEELKGAWLPGTVRTVREPESAEPGAVWCEGWSYYGDAALLAEVAGRLGVRPAGRGGE
jgi:hypothetical protein